MFNYFLFRLPLLSLLFIFYNCPSSYAQTISNFSFNSLKNGTQQTVDYQQNYLHSQDLGTNPQIQSVIETLTSLGNSSDVIAIAVDLVQAGADPESVINLMINLNGLVQNTNQVNTGQLNRAITAYNTLIDRSDFQTLTKLKSTPAFMDIRTLLQKL